MKGFNQIHPAAALIGFSRVQGNRQLYGSDLKHQAYMTLRVKVARESQEHGYTSYSGGQEYIGVDLSFSQYAELISSHNIGDGVPCTLRRLNGVGYDYEVTTTDTDQIKSQVEETLEETVKSIDDILETIVELKLSQTSKTYLRSLIQKVRQNLNDSIPYTLSCTDELIETKVQRAKTEVVSYFDLVAHQRGLDAIAAAQVRPLFTDYTDTPGAEVTEI